jgi:membrane associated rhomboid family serine protease
MIPIRDDNPTLRTPVVTIAIIGLNAAAWILLQGAGAGEMLAESVCTLGLIPGELTGLAAGKVLSLGHDVMCVVDKTPGWYTLITAMFMHGSWFHIIGNMWFLWIFGNNVEDAMGRFRFVVFYLLSGLAAAATHIAIAPDSAIPMVGASGAIGGIMGAYVILYPKVPVHLLVIFGFYVTTIAVPAFVMLGYWFLLQLLSGLPQLGGGESGVAFWAHVGGFAAGLILIFLFRNPKLVETHRKMVERMGGYRYGRRDRWPRRPYGR